jgi:hypothetical protein
LNSPELAKRCLSILAEQFLSDDPQSLRILGYKLEQAGEVEQAISVFSKGNQSKEEYLSFVVKKIRPEEPQSFRDLAIALSRYIFVWYLIMAPDATRRSPLNNLLNF